jgi:hypothetical protein
MRRDELNDLAAFAREGAGEGNLTRAGARLGMSQPALRHTMKGLEIKVSPMSRSGAKAVVPVGGETDRSEGKR